MKASLYDCLRLAYEMGRETFKFIRGIHLWPGDTVQFTVTIRVKGKRGGLHLQRVPNSWAYIGGAARSALMQPPLRAEDLQKPSGQLL